MKNLTSYIWLGLALAAFIVLWQAGYLLRFSHYVQSTRDELKKCNWPSRDELRESTITVMISIVLLAIFTAVVDFVLAFLVGWVNG